MTEHVHDCVVVGAGPAGSAAALQMARDGLDVVLLERGTRPGEKNVMSGVLVTRILHSLIPDFRERAPLQRCITGGYGGEVAAIVAKEAFGYLDSPIQRVATPDTTIPFSRPLLEAIIPSEKDIVDVALTMTG